MVTLNDILAVIKSLSSEDKQQLLAYLQQADDTGLATQRVLGLGRGQIIVHEDGDDEIARLFEENEL